MEQIMYQSVAVGFVFLTIGIILGAVWAKYAWGGYWSWDPKETWSLITWLVYAAYLHARYIKGLSGKPLAYFTIIGFLSVIFTYYGVNLIIPGLHSYAQ
jgi:cytochrome c-type biogenesis protein CcsB